MQLFRIHAHEVCHIIIAHTVESACKQQPQKEHIRRVDNQRINDQDMLCVVEGSYAGAHQLLSKIHNCGALRCSQVRFKGKEYGLNEGSDRSRIKGARCRVEKSKKRVLLWFSTIVRTIRKAEVKGSRRRPSFSSDSSVLSREKDVL
jgi:hypothetical protein